MSDLDCHRVAGNPSLLQTLDHKDRTAKAGQGLGCKAYTQWSAVVGLLAFTAATAGLSGYTVGSSHRWHSRKSEWPTSLTTCGSNSDSNCFIVLREDHSDVNEESGQEKDGEKFKKEIAQKEEESIANAEESHSHRTSRADGSDVKSEDSKQGEAPKKGYTSETVAICGFMNSERVNDVKERLMYHRWIGVDKVFLVENTFKNKVKNAVSPEYTEAFTELQEEGFLDLGSWPKKYPRGQQLWYSECSRKAKAANYTWVLFIDLDEFVVQLNEGRAVKNPDLKEFLGRHEQTIGLSLQWVRFGSSGLRDRPASGGPLRHYDRCTDDVSRAMKCLARTDQLADTPFIGTAKIHNCCYKCGSV